MFVKITCKMQVFLICGFEVRKSLKYLAVELSRQICTLLTRNLLFLFIFIYNIYLMIYILKDMMCLQLKIQTHMELDFMVLMAPFQLGLFHDSMVTSGMDE